jgi:hypothetical protein
MDMAIAASWWVRRMGPLLWIAGRLLAENAAITHRRANVDAGRANANYGHFRRIRPDRRQKAQR